MENPEFSTSCGDPQCPRHAKTEPVYAFDGSGSVVGRVSFYERCWLAADRQEEASVGSFWYVTRNEACPAVARGFAFVVRGTAEQIVEAVRRMNADGSWGRGWSMSIETGLAEVRQFIAEPSSWLHALDVIQVLDAEAEEAALVLEQTLGLVPREGASIGQRIEDALGLYVGALMVTPAGDAYGDRLRAAVVAAERVATWACEKGGA